MYNIVLVPHIPDALAALREGIYAVACVFVAGSWVVIPKGNVPVAALTGDTRFVKSSVGKKITASFVTFSFKGDRAELLNALVASIGNIGKVCDL